MIVDTQQAPNLDLYVAGNTVNSRRAKCNLEFLLKRLETPYTVSVIDVLQTPDRAMKNSIFTTPALILTVGAKRVLIVGDLNDMDAVLSALHIH